jgi:hypothetical protein
MESLLTLTTGDYHLVELTLRYTMTLIAMTALMQILCLIAVDFRVRLSLIFSGIALLGAGWFESGVWGAWKEAFELAGSSYCVTGHLLAGEDRIIAWSLGAPAILIGFGLLYLKPVEPSFRYLLGAALGWAILGPFFRAFALFGFALCAFQLRSHLKKETLVAVGSMAIGILITEFGNFHLLPLGKTAAQILVRGEVIHSLCDFLLLVVAGVSLLIAALGSRQSDTIQSRQ